MQHAAPMCSLRPPLSGDGLPRHHLFQLQQIRLDRPAAHAGSSRVPAHRGILLECLMVLCCKGVTCKTMHPACMLPPVAMTIQLTELTVMIVICCCPARASDQSNKSLLKHPLPPLMTTWGEIQDTKTQLLQKVVECTFAIALNLYSRAIVRSACFPD